MNILKKTIVTTCAIAALSLTALSATSTGASAGWKKHRHHNHFHGRFFKHHNYGYDYGSYCKPKYRKLWIWSPRHGRKVKRLVQVGKWCNGRYYSTY